MPIQNSSPRELLTTSYNREQAVRYANYWAYRRNPNYSSFDSLGGDCTNFVSQALFYAAGVMNFTPDYGWYYISLGNRAPAWSGVEYFWNFMTTNMGPGPFGHEISLSEVLPGDIIQMAIKEPERFGHTVIVTDLLSQSPGPDSILVAAHDRDSACRPISTYDYSMIRALRIDGVRYLSAATDFPTFRSASPDGEPAAGPEDTEEPSGFTAPPDVG